MTVANNIKRTGLPFLRNPSYVDKGSSSVHEPHDDLVHEGHTYLRLIPVEDHSVGGWDHTREPHAEEEGSPERPGAAIRQRGGEQGHNYRSAKYGDRGEVEEAPVWLVCEDVEDWGEEGADYHEGDAGVVEPPEEVVEATGMAAEEVGN